MPYPVYFTLEEARAVLPVVNENLRKLQTVHLALEFLSNIQIENEDGDPEVDVLITKLNMNYYKRLFLYHKYLSKLLSIGAVIKDLRLGLVDFYSKYEGRDILLCWKSNETDILYWHEPDTGYMDRQPIDLLEKQTTNDPYASGA